MAKGKKRYFDASSNSPSKKRHGKGEVAVGRERADPERSDFYYDEVDQFHQDREKVHLDRVRRRSPTSAVEEVYRIRSDDEEESDNDDINGKSNQEENGHPDNDASEGDMGSDISDDDNEEGYLPSADAWGKRRQAYYSADFAGDEQAGLSGSDVEAAELEEQEAISLQKRLAQQMTEDDFKLDSAEILTSKSQKAKTWDKEIVSTDLSSLTEEEKLELVKQQSPELLPLIEEYQTKSTIVEDQLKPVVDAFSSNKRKGSENGTGWIMEWIYKKYELYMNYLINLKFYFVLKASRHAIDNHPVIDRIMSLKKLVEKFDGQHSHFDKHLPNLANIIKAGSSVDDIADLINSFKAAKGMKKRLNSVETSQEKKKKVRWNLEGVEPDETIDEEQDIGEVDETGKRAVPYEIEKNKGLTPRRKKEQRNPRVKNKMRFKKALHRKKSQVPDVRKELQRYGGEIRGIKSNVIRSVKLH